MELNFPDDNQSVVAKIPHFNGDYLQDSIETALEVLGGFEKYLKAGDQIMLKPNFNCSNPIPLSTDLGFLAAIIEVLQDHGAIVTVGEMCGRAAWPTEKVIKDLRVLPVLKRHGVPFIDFSQDEWLEIPVETKHWTKVHVPRSIYEAEHRIYLSNMRGHVSTRFSGMIKLCVGWMSPEDREIMHEDPSRSEEMIAEFNTLWKPELSFMDMRRSIVKKEGRGTYIFPNYILSSPDMVAIDTEGVRELQKEKAENRVNVPVEEMKLLTTARDLGLGKMDYEVIETEAHLYSTYGMGPSDGGVMYPFA